MFFGQIVKLFDKGNVCVVGLRGTGKDVLFGNVVNRRKHFYTSNTNYGGRFIPFRFKDIDCGGNSYKDFLAGTIKYYEYPNPDKTDVFLADVGVYLPSQYCNELNKAHPELTVFQALSRHVGDCNLHFNVQNLNRAWDKLREQSDTYIQCNWCKVLFGKIVIQHVTIYDNYQSCCMRVKPWRVKLPLFASKEMRLSMALAKQQYENTHGMICPALLIYINKSKHDTRAFREVLRNGKIT